MAEVDWDAIGQLQETYVEVLTGFRARLASSMPEMGTEAIDDLVCTFFGMVAHAAK